MKKEKKVTFADIAAFTGFSKTTVSRYFNDPDSLTEENQAKIADALEKLNYKENKLAKVLANGKTEIVGVIIPNLYMHYYSDILGRLIGTYEKFGYKFIVFSGNDDPEAEKNYITELLSYNIEGLIVLSHTIPSEQLCKLDIPLVTIEREDRHIFSVNTDNYMGGVQAASLLVKSGCDTVIHFNSEITEDVPAYGRIKGFKEFCESNGIDHRVVLKDAGNTFEENSAVIQSFFVDLEKQYPDKKIGVFMSNDTHANILLNIIFRKYGKLPSRFCIIGFDDSPVSREAIIPLSTIGQQVDGRVHRGQVVLPPGGDAHAVQLFYIALHAFGGVVGQKQIPSALLPYAGEKGRYPVEQPVVQIDGPVHVQQKQPLIL